MDEPPPNSPPTSPTTPATVAPTGARNVAPRRNGSEFGLMTTPTSGPAPFSVSSVCPAVTEPPLRLHLEGHDARAAADDDLVVRERIRSERVVAPVHERHPRRARLGLNPVLKQLGGGREPEVAELQLRAAVQVEKPVRLRLQLRNRTRGPWLSKSVPP